MLGWVQRVLPQPPGTPQKAKGEEEEEKEEEPQPEPELEPEAEPGPEPEAEAAPEEAVPEDMPQPAEEPVEGEGVAEADPDLQEVQEAAPPLPTALQAPVAVDAEVNSPRNWVLTWLLKSMDKVMPQPVCNSGGAHNTAAGVEDPAQAGAQTLGSCGTGDAGSSDGFNEAQETGLSPWLLRWLEHNLEKVLPQPPKPSEACKAEPADAVLDPEPPVLPVETEPAESPSPPSPGILEPEEDPAMEMQPGLYTSSLPPPGDPAKLIAWLLHRLEMALPQPVPHRKTGEQEPGCSGTCDVQTRVAAAGGL